MADNFFEDFKISTIKIKNGFISTKVNKKRIINR